MDQVTLAPCLSLPLLRCPANPLPQAQGLPVTVQPLAQPRPMFDQRLVGHFHLGLARFRVRPGRQQPPVLQTGHQPLCQRRIASGRDKIRHRHPPPRVTPVLGRGIILIQAGEPHQDIARPRLLLLRLQAIVDAVRRPGDRLADPAQRLELLRPQPATVTALP